MPRGHRSSTAWQWCGQRGGDRDEDVSISRHYGRVGDVDASCPGLAGPKSGRSARPGPTAKEPIEDVLAGAAGKFKPSDVKAAAARQAAAIAKAQSRLRPRLRVADGEFPALPIIGPGDTPDYYATPNWANSPPLTQVRRPAAAALGPEGRRRRSGQVPAAGRARHHHLSRIRLLRDRAAGVRRGAALRDAGDDRCAATCRSTTAPTRSAANTVVPGADPLPRSADRRPEGPPGPHQVHQQARLRAARPRFRQAAGGPLPAG